MNTPKLPQDALFELERKIARRADELTRRLGLNHRQALEHWRQAEREVWGDLPTRARSKSHSAAAAGH